jgi:dephospho-CoA kinase
MLNVGLTGGIGCGKSTVAQMLVDKGAHLIDFDVLVRDAQAPDRPAWKAIVERFGTDILRADRSLDRDKLGALVFPDREKLGQLNDIVHPVVFGEWHQQLSEIEKTHPEAIVLSDVPLLIEVGMEERFDVVLLVYASPEAQIRRIMERNGYSREEAQERLAAQMPIDEKLRRADVVIRNEASLALTREDVARVWEELVARERAKREAIS